MSIIWQVLLWSFNALYEGKWPAANWDGTEYAPESAEAQLAGLDLAGGFFGIPFLLKGDWEHFAKSFGLRPATARECCDWCTCRKGRGTDPRNWPTNFGQSATWKTGLLSATQWRNRNDGLLHSLFVAFPFLSNQNVEGDEMHIIHLGVTQVALGSVLHLLAYEVLPRTPAQNIEAVWHEVCMEYRASGIDAQFSNLGLKSFCDPAAPNFHFPRLKGKAAECKWLVKPLRAVWHRHMDPNSPDHVLVLQLLDEQLRIQDLLDEESSAYHMNPASAEELVLAVDSFLAVYARLAQRADLAHRLLWNAVPKLHALWHFARQAAWLHPRRGACYQDEDFMGRVKGAVQSCTAATPLHQIARTVLEKYRWGMYFQYLMI
jgi:hypothetical protein